MSTEIGQLLANTLSADHSTREDASQKLELGAKTDYRGYALALSTELANEQAQRDVRMAAGLALKNSLSAKEYNRKQEMAQRWISIDEQARNQVKQLSLLTLASQDLKAGAAAGQVIAAIAEIELPQGQWPDLIQLLLNNVTSTDNDRMKQSTLQALGYVCEATDPDVLTSQANQILTAVVQGARKEETNQEVRLAAINALYNSLEFIRDNFEREGERNYIMQVVCEATQSSDVRVQVASFECLVRIMQLYYDKMRFYMEKALFGLTVLGMKHVNVSVALQAVEFWSTVCDEEIELQEEAMEAAENGEQMDRVNYNFAQAALGEILPVLLSLLTKQEEDEDEDEWNISMASGTCLSLLAQTVRDTIVPPVIPFVEGNIRNADWRCREAAVMAFGSILEGPDDKLLASLVDQALPVLIEMMRDPVIQVKDTVAWTLGRVSDVLVDCIKPDVHLHGLITALVLGLQDNPRIVSNCCWSLMNLAEQLGSDGPDIENTPLSMFFDGIITALMQFTDRADNEANSRTSAYEAISTLVTHAAKDCFPTIEKLSVTSLDRLEATITMANQIIGVDERNAHFELQSNLLSVVTNCIRKLGKQIIPLADRTMTILLQLLNSASKQSTITEDTFLAVGALTTALEADFTRYLEAFVPFLFTALQNHEEHQLCAIAVGLIGDICRALGEGSLPYCDSFMQLLIADLQSPVLHRNVKPAILSCFGDIALAISGKFEAYLQLVMTVLQQAGEMRAEKDNYDMIDYLNQLHEGMVEAYVGIVQGLKAGEKVQLLVPYVQHIFSFLGGVYRDPYRSDAVTRSMIGLLGDLGEAFASGQINQIKQLFQEDWVNLCLRDGRTSRHYGPGTKEVARWAKEMVKRASQ